MRKQILSGSLVFFVGMTLIVLLNGEPPQKEVPPKWIVEHEPSFPDTFTEAEKDRHLQYFHKQ